jgi:hypothetical protein
VSDGISADLAELWESLAKDFCGIEVGFAFPSWIRYTPSMPQHYYVLHLWRRKAGYDDLLYLDKSQYIYYYDLLIETYL